MIDHQEPGLAKCAAGPTLDGIDVDRWVELADLWRGLGIHERVSLLNFARELGRGGESARSIGLAEALAEVDRLIADSQRKHPGSRWKTHTVTHHLAKMIGHAAKFMAGERLDPDSRRYALSHVVARGLMALQLCLEEDKRR